MLAHRLVAWPNALTELVVMLLASGGIYLGWLAWRERPLLNRLVALVRS
jgi:hypothetical protein